MRTRGVTAALAAALALVAIATAASGAGAASSARAIRNTKPLWTAHARRLGAAPHGAKVSARVYLAPRGGLAALAQAATAMSRDRHFLTPAQYRARFGTTAATVHAVAAYLRWAGLRVTRVGAGNRYVSFTGTVASAERAFGAEINRYRHHGRIVQAPSSALKVPASLARSVLAIAGLDTTPKIVKPNVAPPPGFRNAPPCSAYYGEKLPATLPQFNGRTLPYAPCGYTGMQFRSAYEGNSSLDGSGISVAITDAYAAPTIAFDAATYAARHGDRAYGEGQLTQTVPPNFIKEGKCGAAGWYGEETLDVEAVHAMAPGARIHYYASASCYDSEFLDTLGRVVDDGTSQLVTNSWSDVEAVETPDVTAAYQAIFLQGATEGISFMFSSGDDGDELAATGTKQVDYPSSDPYATGVGGTSAAFGAANNRIFETGWGTDKYSLSADGASWNPLGFLYGGGGGESMLFARPAYQNGVTSSPTRQVPDVAMDGDPTTGMLVGETQSFPKGVIAYDEYRIGGTSLSSPLFAGMTALALQRAGGAGAGLLNNAIYSHLGSFTDIAGTPPDAGNVRVDYANDVDASRGLLYSVRTFDQDSSLLVTTGYDQVTGVGIPNTGWLNALR